MQGGKASYEWTDEDKVVASSTGGVSGGNQGGHERGYGKPFLKTKMTGWKITTTRNEVATHFRFFFFFFSDF